MKILLTGATGFIGTRLRAELLARGHRVVAVARRPPPPRHAHERWIAIDFATAQAAHWRPHLAGVDAVVNAVGIFRERGAQTFAALHVQGPAALFEACVGAGVARVVQISALGADAEAATGYHRSKRAADEHLLALPLDAVAAQPSLVFGPGGASARAFLALAALPLVPLPAGGGQRVQPLHVDDAVLALAALVEAAPRAWAGQRVPLAGPTPLTLAAYLQALRHGLRLPPARCFAVPAWAMAIAARVGDRLPGALLDTASWQMLQRGNVAPPAATRRLLGRPARAPTDFVEADTASALRAQARLAWLLPLLRASIAAVWIVTAFVSAFVWPVADSYALLARSGVPAALQPAALYGAAALDLLLGVLTLALPRAHRRALWIAQAALMLGYMALIAWKLPEFWLHPYGPLLKNLPMLAALLLLDTFDRDDDARWTT